MTPSQAGGRWDVARRSVEVRRALCLRLTLKGEVKGEVIVNRPSARNSRACYTDRKPESGSYADPPNYR